MNDPAPAPMQPSAHIRRIARPAAMTHLPELIALAAQACDEAQASDEVRYAVRLAVEEVSVNIITHGYAGQEPGPIELALSWDSERMVIEISDRARPFAPDDAPAPDRASHWEDRSLGGLGWQLVRQVIDEIHYRFDPGHGNRLTLIKQLTR